MLTHYCHNVATGFAAPEAYANVASYFGTRKLIYEIIRCGIAI